MSGGWTKGPWAVHPRLPGVIVGGEAVQVPNGSFQRQVAAANFATEMTSEEFDANARLIAAAPDLADALEEVSEWITAWSPAFADDDEWPTTATKMRAALRKAREGQSNG